MVLEDLGDKNHRVNQFRENILLGRNVYSFFLQVALCVAYHDED